MVLGDLIAGVVRAYVKFKLKIQRPSSSQTQDPNGAIDSSRQAVLFGQKCEIHLLNDFGLKLPQFRPWRGKATPSVPLDQSFSSVLGQFKIRPPD